MIMISAGGRASTPPALLMHCPPSIERVLLQLALLQALLALLPSLLQALLVLLPALLPALLQALLLVLPLVLLVPFQGCLLLPSSVLSF